MKIRLYLRVRLANGNRQFIDPVYAANGRLKPFYAVVDGNAEHHPEGVYYLRHLKHGKRAWEPNTQMIFDLVLVGECILP
jgi:hypothetical protein